MAELAQYQRTELGSGVQQNPQGAKQINSVKSGSILRLENQIKAAEQQLANKKDQEFKLTLRKSLLTDEISEVSYYTELGNWYEQKMNNTKNKYERLGYEVQMLTSRKSAEGAAKASAGAARSGASKQVTADRYAAEDAINASTVQYAARSSDGDYKTAEEELSAKQSVYNMTYDYYYDKANDETLSASMRRSSRNKFNDLIKVASDPQAGGMFGGLDYQIEHKEDYVGVMKDNGGVGYEIKKNMPRDQNIVETLDGTFAQIKGGIWKETTSGLKQTDGGMYMYENPTTGEIERLNPATETSRIAEINETQYVDVLNPNNPQYESNRFEITDDNKFYNEQNGNTYDKPFLREHLGSEDLFTQEPEKITFKKEEEKEIGLPDFSLQQSKEPQQQQQTATDVVNSSQTNIGGYNDWKSQFGNML